uniref:Intraflagellar transport protein 81 homolog n=1 Tax=Heterorhabditis bacteriophora TaxID=37862 RepID=A0A1I7XUP6_HETBA
MSSDVLNLIVQALNRPPFNCNVTLISFDSWSPSKLLQQFSDVISWVTQTDTIDITKESADETAIRLLHHLKILRFRPPTDIGELEEWRAGIVEGAKRSIYPVLFYVFSNVDMLKQRAYLAKYLVEIPSGIHDAETAQLQNELGQLMERFKESHAQVVEVQQDSLIVDEIKTDLKAMEIEKEALIRKIDKAHRKVQNMPGLDKYMVSAENLRKEKERLADMNIQKTEQRKGRLKEQLKEVRQAGENIDPTNLLAQLEVAY